MTSFVSASARGARTGLEHTGSPTTLSAFGPLSYLRCFRQPTLNWGAYLICSSRRVGARVSKSISY